MFPPAAVPRPCGRVLKSADPCAGVLTGRSNARARAIRNGHILSKSRSHRSCNRNRSDQSSQFGENLTAEISGESNRFVFLQNHFPVQKRRATGETFRARSTARLAADEHVLSDRFLVRAKKRYNFRDLPAPRIGRKTADPNVLLGTARELRSRSSSARECEARASEKHNL